MKKEGIYDRDITSAPHTNVKTPPTGNGDYDPNKRAADLEYLANFGPKSKEQPKDKKAKKQEGVLEQVYAVQKPYSGCQLTSLIHPIDPLVGLGGSEVTPDQVHGVYHDQDQASAVAQEVYEAYCKQEEALEEKKGLVSNKIKEAMSMLEKRRSACVEAIKENPMEATKHRQEAANYATKIDELVTKLEQIEKSKKPIDKKEDKKKDHKKQGLQEAADNEYQYMDNYQLLDVLNSIYKVYSNEDFAKTEPKFLEAADHIKQAIDIITSRSGN